MKVKNNNDSKIVKFWLTNLEEFMSFSTHLFLLKNYFYNITSLAYKSLVEAEKDYVVFCKETIIELERIFSKKVLAIKFDFTKLDFVKHNMDLLHHSQYGHVGERSKEKLAKIRKFLTSIKLATFKAKLSEEEIDKIRQKIKIIKCELFS